MKLVHLLSWMLFCSLQITAQTQIWFLEGTIEEAPGVPLSGATVYVGQESYAQTNEQGVFQIKLGAKPSFVEVNMLGYKKYHIPGDSMRWLDHSLKLSILLSPDLLQLAPATISARSKSIVFKENFAERLLDYQLIGDNLLLLVKSEKRLYLRLIGAQGELLQAFELPSRLNFKFLHESCTGSMHVIGPSRSLELLLSEKQIDTLGGYASADFFKFIQPCSAQFKGNYFFQNRSDLGQRIQYTWIDTAGTVRPLIQIFNADMYAHLRQIQEDFYSKKLFMVARPYELDPSISFNTVDPDLNYNLTEDWWPAAPVGKDLNVSSMLDAMSAPNDDQMANLSALEMTYADSVYAPMFKIGDYMYVFNHPKRKLLRFNPLKLLENEKLLLEETELSYHLEGKWQKQVLVDQELNRVYGRFLSPKYGLVFKEISLIQGQTTRVYAVDAAPYLSKNHRIRNGVLYFIGQPDVNVPNSRLYKIDLAQYLIR